MKSFDSDEYFVTLQEKEKTNYKSDKERFGSSQKYTIHKNFISIHRSLT